LMYKRESLNNFKSMAPAIGLSIKTWKSAKSMISLIKGQFLLNKKHISKLSKNYWILSFLQRILYMSSIKTKCIYRISRIDCMNYLLIR
jgi:hypothetical protein